jgi:ubiquinone/menaquinone biosynthesis C-methylase UbiE
MRSHYREIWDAQAWTLDSAKIGVAGYTDEEMFVRTAQETINRLRDCVGIKPLDVILEIGAGVGRVGQRLAPLCAKWVGADVSGRMLRHLRRRLETLPNVESVVLNGYDLSPFPVASFDLVYSTVVFMHLEEWERYRYVREGLRVLKPGGRMLVDNVNLLSEQGWALFEKHVALDPRSRPLHVSKTSTPQELETYFRRAGFEQVSQAFQDLWVTTWGMKPTGRSD